MKRLCRMLYALLLLALLAPAGVRAHGGGVPQITAAPVGSYLLYVWTDPAAPRAGDTLHVTIALTLPAPDGAETPVTDAAVTVRLALEAGAPVELTAEPGAAAGGVFYEADAALPQGGDWRVTVAVDGAQGAGDLSFVLPVTAAPGLPWGWAGLGASFLLLALLGIQTVRSRRRATDARPRTASL